MKIHIVVAVSGIVFLSGCPFVSKPTIVDNACTVTPPQSLSADNSASAKVAADLTLYAAAPVKGDIEASVTNKFNNTYQSVSDKNAACNMLLQTTVCMAKTPENASARDALLKIVQQKC